MVLLATVLRDRLKKEAREEAGKPIRKLSQSPRPKEIVTLAVVEVELFKRNGQIVDIKPVTHSETSDSP